MSSALYRELFQLRGYPAQRGGQANELGAAAGFVNAVLESGIDQLFTDLARGEVSSAEVGDSCGTGVRTSGINGSWQEARPKPKQRSPRRLLGAGRPERSAIGTE
jgi:hypothetical protein